METNSVEIRWSNQQVIDLVRALRDELIQVFLDERFLTDYIALNFGVAGIHPDQLKAVKDSLKILELSPLNIDYYHLLLDQIRITDSASLTAQNDSLFYAEIELLIEQQLNIRGTD